MALGRPAWRETRALLTRLLDKGEGELRDNSTLCQKAIIPMVHTRPSSTASKRTPAALVPRRLHFFYLCLLSPLNLAMICAAKHISRAVGTLLQVSSNQPCPQTGGGDDAPASRYWRLH